ncbi:hypothetical protein J4E08_21840 [Sagittula sp. NFXS13]|uniref:hypothetical protein n=1 Tax=Sagittula sp. NFXS13 TaxID=2819095 RepID=UPI0032E021DD
MLAPAPHIPRNLKQKLTAAVRPFQREYDAMTLAEARRLLARHDFKMPVLCSLVFHGSGNVKHVDIRENLKRQPPSSTQFSGSVGIFTSLEDGERDLRSECLRWIAESAAKTFLAEGRHQVFRMSDADIEAHLRKTSEYSSFCTIGFRDVSPLAIRRIIERERDLRLAESAHERLRRYARQPNTEGFLEELKTERADADCWYDEMIAKGYTPLGSFEYETWPEEQRIVLAYREHLYWSQFF